MSPLVCEDIGHTVSPDPAYLDGSEFPPVYQFDHVIRAAIQDFGDVFGSEKVVFIGHVSPPRICGGDSQRSETQALVPTWKL